jgi:hypothetical protein
MATRADVSRRRFLAILGAGCAAVASAWGPGGCAPAPPRKPAHPEPIAYVDHKGWMVTVADEQKLNR